MMRNQTSTSASFKSDVSSGSGQNLSHQVQTEAPVVCVCVFV